MSPDSPRTILIVDDDAAVRSVVRRILSVEPVRLLEAPDGHEAEEIAARTRLDLILLDIQMPRKSGLEVLRDLRADPRTRAIPVLFLTARSGPEDAAYGLELGADDYVGKPFLAQELLARIHALARRRERDLQAHPLTGLPGSAAIEAEATRRIAAGEPLALLYADLDGFKAYNDAFGYERGDQAILDTARLLLEAARASCDPDAYVGHVGGDDFVLLARTEAAEKLARDVARRFDLQFAGQTGLTLSVAVATNDPSLPCPYSELVAAAAQVKRGLKARSDRSRSACLKDRRKGLSPEERLPGSWVREDF